MANLFTFIASKNGAFGDPQELRWDFLEAVDEDGTIPGIQIEHQVCCGIMHLDDGDYIQIDTNLNGSLVVPSFKVVRLCGNWETGS